jgi:hypothetical protein
MIQGNTEVLGEKYVMMPLCHESHMDWPGPETGLHVTGQ